MSLKRCLPALLLLLAGCGGSDGGVTPIDPGLPGSGTATVLTYHNDNRRSGLNDKEGVLKPANVDAAHFGKVGFFKTDGKVDAQPLFVSAELIGGKRHDMLYVVTEHDSVYAFDAASGKVYWHRSL